ncbi:palmitoyltransferase ZDHHC20-A-like [Xenopus laevis]|uniref:Palmitoyltransferase n=2 Tax=Xenopus laevis TaxID=8355 RepID=A0A1L8GBZ5_XENLA|nr:palmitoyltransferase ZDHHC20-A-like [Xenopus laevis]OCT81295.1 hypothetical protein XELAEV_18028113mg [Xenopus laevis]
MVTKEETHTVNIDEEEEDEDYDESDHCFTKCISYFLVSLISCILVVAYYITVVELCIFTVEPLALKLTFLVTFHLFYILCVWSFLRTILSRPVTPPAKFCLSESDKKLYLSEESQEKKQEILVHAAKDLPIYTRDRKGDVRYCEKCQVLKPDRCHHCPVCNVCILKLDHHCVFLSNCVGFSNYKFFLLSVGYGLLLSIMTSAMSFYCLKLFWTNRLPETDSKAPITYQAWISTVLSLIFFPFLYSHLVLASNNITAMSDGDEDDDDKHKAGKHSKMYDLGFSKNIRQVFGDKKIYWLFPIFSSLGDGFSFPRGDATDIEKNAATDN